MASFTKVDLDRLDHYILCQLESFFFTCIQIPVYPNFRNTFVQE